MSSNLLPDFLSFDKDIEDPTFMWSNLSKEEVIEIGRSLHQENKFYKNLVYCGGTESEPLDGIVVVYFENEASSKYKSKIDLFFDELFAKDSQKSSSEDQLSVSSKKSKKRVDFIKLGKPYSIHYGRSFTVSSNKRRSSAVSPPRYIINKASSPVKETTEPTRRAFNRRRFLCDSQVINTESFSKFKPGHISSELVAALGLKRGELPMYIYKMRVFGYPPGWEKNLLQKGDISVKSVISYHGFNVAPQQNSIDKSSHYGLPPFSESWSRKNYLFYLNDYVKRNPQPRVESPTMYSHPSTPPNDPMSNDPTQERWECVQSPPRVKSPPSSVGISTLIGLESTLLLKGKKSLPPMENFSDGLMPLVLDNKEVSSGGGYARCMKVLSNYVNKHKS